MNALPSQEASAAQLANGRPVIFFSADGVRPDIADKYMDAGIMPTYAKVRDSGVQGDNGLVTGVATNSGVNWTTLATGAWPATHGQVNNVYYDTSSSSFAEVGIGFDGSRTQAQSIAQAAEAFGKTVVALDWSVVTELDPAIQGPLVEYRIPYSANGILTNFDLDGHPARAHEFGVGYQRDNLAPATGWRDVPPSNSPAYEVRLSIGTTPTSEDPEWVFDLYIYDSVDDDTVKYDRILVVPAEGAKDGARSVGALGRGEWLDVKVKLTGEKFGQAAGFYLHPIDFTDDLEKLRLYYTAVTRSNASYIALGESESAAFAEHLNAEFPTATGPDWFPVNAGIIEEDTFAAQGRLWQRSRLAYLDYILGELGVRPDLLMMGTPVTDEVSHQIFGLLTETDPDGNPNPFYDDKHGSGIKDGAVHSRRKMLENVYKSADELLGRAISLLGGEPNIVLASDHGIAPCWFTVNAKLALEGVGLAAQDAVIPADVDLATVQVKVCAVGGTANVYINLVGRDVPGLVLEEEYEAVRDRIVSAFATLRDPSRPQATVVQQVFRKEELCDVQGTDALHPTRSGDVLVILKPPYMFDFPSPDALIAATPMFGDHGYLPDAVDLEHDINMHGIFYAAGPAFASGGKVVHQVRAIDLAPTIAHILGVPAPADSSGVILVDALAPTSADRVEQTV